MRDENIIADKSLEFALRVVRLYKYLCEEKKEFVLSKQVLRSGTSIGANIKEALHAQSTKDFIAKLHISLKEASETEYWLTLLSQSGYITEEQYSSINDDCVEIIRILTSIINTTKKNYNNQTNS